MEQIVINGNNIELLKNYPDNYFDSVVTDRILKNSRSKNR
jgi:hypothetical protein